MVTSMRKFKIGSVRVRQAAIKSERAAEEAIPNWGRGGLNGKAAVPRSPDGRCDVPHKNFSVRLSFRAVKVCLVNS